MNLNTHYEEYAKHLEQKEHERKETISMCSRISFWRGISFLTAGALFYFAYEQRHYICYPFAAAAVIAFIIFIRYHNQLKQQAKDLENDCFVLKDDLARFDDGWKDFIIDGGQYLNEHAYKHPEHVSSRSSNIEISEAKDLDIFGQHSLFQYICTAGTIYGQDQLAEWLCCPDKNIEEIKARQQAVAELSSKPEFALQFESAARSLRGTDYNASKKIMQDFFQAVSAAPERGQHYGNAPQMAGCGSITGRLASSVLGRWISWVLPALTMLFLAAAVLGVYQAAAAACAMLFMTIQLLSALLMYHHHNKLLAPVYKMNQTITPYRRLMELIEQESFDSPYLCALQKDLIGSRQKTNMQKMTKNTTDSRNASRAFQELEKIADSVVVRHNLFALILCNSLFLYDFHCVQRFAAWKQNYRNLIFTWLAAAGRIEALISLGVVSRTKKTFAMPDLLSQTQPHLSGACIQHPLIDEAAAVGNDFDLRHQTCIITGSNMSGKTTFMRSIGMNLVLAYAGGYCTAADFHVSFMKICTSMRTQDNVSEGISTFYAELLRIKKMADLSRQQIPMISLIDEIYKGTNSKDRIYAAMETVRTLAQPFALTMITTHDLELCELEYEEKIDAENYYFSEYYEHDEIRFDYKIRKGRSQTANARYLLRMAGILDQQDPGGVTAG